MVVSRTTPPATAKIPASSVGACPTAAAAEISPASSTSSTAVVKIQTAALSTLSAGADCTAQAAVARRSTV